ncbi:unnamed protein product [Parnassius mnemosyne]|uniref:THAP-type domain-containing protein n=1 Tax=Parnassius mnemosyne TaxID=213953 RepID=A0AAV1KYP4_9NEOP
MPRKSAIKCYFGCANAGPFHQFPKPEYPNLEKFEQWKMVLNEDMKRKGDSFIFKNIRICDCHFEEFYRSASKRLTRNAVPTLNLSSTSPIVLQPSSSVKTEMDIDMQIGDNLESIELPYPKQKLLPTGCLGVIDLVDENSAIAASLADEEILMSVKKNEEEQDDEEDVNDLEPPISIDQALHAAKLLEKLFYDDPTISQDINKIQRKIQLKYWNKKPQTKLTDNNFFR